MGDRKLVGPALNRKNVRDYVTIAKLIASRFVGKWEEIVAATDDDQVVLTINGDLLAYTMDIISLVVLARDLDSLRKNDKYNGFLGEDIKGMFKGAMFRIFSPIAYWKIPVVGQYLDGCGYKSDRIRRRLHKVIDEHKAILSGDSLEPANEEFEIVQDRTKSFLGKILEQAKKDETHLTEERIVGNLLTMFAAGSETTYNTLLVCLYEIAADTTGLQNEIFQEAMTLFEGGSSKTDDSDIGYNELNEGLPRMRSLMYEVLRVKGPSPMLAGESTKEFDLDGSTQPVGTHYILLARLASMVESDQVSDDSERRTPKGPLNSPSKQFCPRRWLTEGMVEEGKQCSATLGVTKPTFKTGYRPFGTSVRVCPGRDLAEMEILILLSGILRKFEIRLEEDHPPLTFVTRIAQTPNIDIRLALKPRRTGQ